MMPSSGNSTSGISAVANRGMASVIHQIAMSAATAASRLAGTLVGSMGNTSSSTNAAIPSQNPAARALFLENLSVIDAWHKRPFACALRSGPTQGTCPVIVARAVSIPRYTAVALNAALRDWFPTRRIQYAHR